MTRIATKKIKGKTYQYIAKSIRLPDGRVTTLTKRLAPSDKGRSSSALIRKYRNYFIEKEKEINKKWAVSHFKQSHIFTEDEIKNMEDMKVSYRHLIKNLDKTRLKDVFDRFICNFTYDSNAIEGNSLTLKDVAIVIFDNETVPGKPLREIFETRNSRNVFDMILKKKFSITNNDIIKIHSLLMKDIDERKGYKKIPNVIYRTEKEVQTTPPELVEKEMSNLISWYESNSRMHPIELATVFHGRFEKIHPFEDGNGRVGRFLVNVILIDNGYTPLIIRKSSRTAYMSALAAFDLGHQDKLKRFLLRKFKDTYRKFFEVYIKYV